ncbi:MAG: GDP-mannose 4,6-dehydratase [Polyangiaceae bacterium]|jgi:hypothetical protein|nr:GDP-mannose 4,6-dehydratase [Polyangiaceae bacterium]
MGRHATAVAVGDVCNLELVRQLVDAQKVDTVVHFAAATHVDRSIHGPLVFTQTNAHSDAPFVMYLGDNLLVGGIGQLFTPFGQSKHEACIRPVAACSQLRAQVLHEPVHPRGHTGGQRTVEPRPTDLDDGCRTIFSPARACGPLPFDRSNRHPSRWQVAVGPAWQPFANQAGKRWACPVRYCQRWRRTAGPTSRPLVNMT